MLESPTVRDHRRRRGLDAVAARLLRQPRHRGIRVDAGVQRHLQVRHHVRRLVDEAGLRELLPSVRLDARQPHDDAVRPQRRGAGQRRRRARAPGPLLHRRAPGRPSACAPKPAESFPFDVWYGYHFDAVLLGQFLHRKALERGVRYKSCHVTHATLDERRRHRLGRARGKAKRSAADLFVDCTGFAGC